MKTKAVKAILHSFFNLRIILIEIWIESFIFLIPINYFLFFQYRFSVFAFFPIKIN